MKCGMCLKEINSFLGMKAHKAQAHGEQNEFSQYGTKAERESQRKERLDFFEERLKQEISKERQRL